MLAVRSAPRLLRRALMVAAGLAALGVVLLLAGLFWPAPHSDLRCRAADGPACLVTAGRVLVVRHDPVGTHIVLLARHGRSWPLLTVLKFGPRADPQGLHIGQWITARGKSHVGSNGEDVLQVAVLARP
jgi:hypothetical protein